MPSVGTRNRTRVFGARVLRSGRRLWSGPPEDRHSGADDGGNGYEDEGEVQLKENGWKRDIPSKQQEITVMDIDATNEEPQSVKSADSVVLHDRSNADRMCARVYQRKRKRAESNSEESLEFRKYGKHYTRKKWRNVAGRLSSQGFERRKLITFVTEYSSSTSVSWFSCILSLILKYMRNGRPRLLKLSALMLSEPVARAFKSHGIRCLTDSVSFKNRGICIISGSISAVPLITVNFLAVPFCFMSLQWSLLLRNSWFPCVPLPHMNVDNNRSHILEPLPQDSTGCEALKSKDDISRAVNVSHPSVRGSRTAQLRNSINSRTIRKKRSSLKSRRVKRAPVFRGPRVNGSLLSALVSSKHGKLLLDPGTYSDRPRSSVQKKSAPDTKEPKSTSLELKEDIKPTLCSANILVVESDSCYRIPGAHVKMEFSSSKQWFLAVKKDGIMLYSLTTREAMRPCSSNRITRDVTWRDEDNSWKLEFPNRQDWLIFKELYKECSTRNVRAPSSDDVPIPGVKEVSDYPEHNGVTFIRPNSYISAKDDELSKVMMKRTPIYDMDSADEEWLRNLNHVSSVANEQWERVTEDTFELMIDAFEKANFYAPDDNHPNEIEAVDLCSNLERKDVVEAVHSYWMKRKKQKKSPLLPVFQLNQPSRRAQLLPRPIIRKKRSVSRRANRSGKGKQQSLIRATRPITITKPEKPMKAFSSVEEHKALLLKVEETKAAASKSELLAIEKRRRVQRLMENADLATYKATMALRIAEAARVAKSAADAAASFFLQ